MPEYGPPTSREIAEIFTALSQETRLEAYRLLIRYQPFGLAAGDLSRLLSVPHNTLSTHLRALKNAGLVRSRKEGRSVIFVADPDRFDVTAGFLGLSGDDKAARDGFSSALHYPVRRPNTQTPGHVHNVLILCSSNSARSLMAEAIVNREGYGDFRAFSAGSTPKRKPHPVAVELLDSLGYDTVGLKPKSWTTFAEPDAPHMDFVLTVCDRAAGEPCPHWPGQPLMAHWGIPSVDELASSKFETRAAFEETYRNLMNRFTSLVNLAVDRLSLDELKRRVGAIGRIEGATDKALYQFEA